MAHKKKLIAVLACRNQGTRLYAKPLQNLDIQYRITILDNILLTLSDIACIDQIVLAIAEGDDNLIYQRIAESKKIGYVIGSEQNVLGRIVEAGRKYQASDIFRVTSESPYLFFEKVQEAWKSHCSINADASFMDNVIDGVGFEIISMNALEISNKEGMEKHRSELCSLYIRENKNKFKLNYIEAPEWLMRNDLRLTVDYPEDLVVCRRIFERFKHQSPRISLRDIVDYLDLNPELIKLVLPYTEAGYDSMYL